MNYIELFESVVAQKGGSFALADRNGTRLTTYAELDRLSSLVAGKLRRMKCKAGDFVIINMSRTMEYQAAYLGILKAGCVIVPTVLDYPAERIAYIASDCNAKLTINDDFFSDIEKYKPCSSPVDDSLPTILAYTSGSTGTPKGIIFSAFDLTSAAERHKCIYDGIQPLIMASSLQMSFLVHIFEYLAVYLLGGTVHIVDDETRKSSFELAKYYKDHAITAGVISPQMLRVFKNTSPYLRRVITGSERVSKTAPDGYEIINGYGMSETGAFISTFKLDRAYDNTPVGKPLKNIGIHIVGDDGKPVPDGEKGEICVTMKTDTHYFRDEEKTRKTMIDLPNGKTFIHTGDIGYINENGDIVYVNRKDWLVKVNGQRVETLEIETLMTDMPQIANAVVKSFVDDDGQTYLVAYYVTATEIKEREIRDMLKRKLPEYMIPRFFVRMEALPKNINGKLDRTSLMPPKVEQYKTSYTAPQTETENILCKAFEKVLRCGTVGTSDDFFDLGGDSIKILYMIEAAGIDGLTPAAVVKGRTPCEIARLCKVTEKNTVRHLDAIPQNCPLTSSQLGVYLECIKDRDSVKYNIPVLCRLPENTDITRFSSAVKAVAEKHKIFLSTAGEVGGIPSVIFSGGEIKIEGKSVENVDEYAKTFRRAFDIERGPLYRFELLRSPSGDAFIFDVHHIIFDGTSLSIFLNQIAEAYLGHECREESLTEFDIATAGESSADDAEIADMRSFFEKKLGNADCDSKPLPDVLTECDGKTAAFVSMPVGTAFDAASVSEYARNEKISANALFLGAFGYTLAKFNGKTESFFTTAHNGRLDPRLASSVGMFVRTLPFVCSFDESQTPAEYLKTVFEDYAKMSGSTAVSFGEVASGYNLRMDVSFIYQDTLLGSVPLGNGTAEVELLDKDSAVSDIEIMLLKDGGEYVLTAHYNSAEYSESFIRSLLDTFICVVKGMMREAVLGDISLVGNNALSLLDSFNNTEKPYEDRKTVVDLFRLQAEVTPDAECLVYNDKHFTYFEVNLITDRLAQYLVSCGIGKGSIVGILIPRCEYMLICSLGVLKSGAAYMPLDPSYPAERLNLMMRDSDAAMLITTPDLSGIITEDFAYKRLMTDEIPPLPQTETELPALSKNDLFIMLYTSGSTGTPKGVMFSHGNVMVTAAWEREFYKLGTGCAVTAYASYGFDANVFDTYATITSGATLHIISDDIRLDLLALRDYFNKNGITHSTMTTQVGRQFALLGGLETLRHLSVAGEKLTPLTPPDGFNMYNLYGPTEGSILVTGFKIDRYYKDVPIGKAIDNVKLYVTDKLGRRLPAGASGELWLSGAHVTQGYKNRPEKTAEAYINNPFSSERGYEKIYRTGDVVRFLCDGNIQFVGRSDGQVKIRGFRVELTEVEEVIRRFAGINDATVAAYDESSGGKFIAAYVVSDEKIDISALNEFIKSEKPPYMVPSVTMQIDKIPLNQNQKVNKKALPYPKRTSENLTPPETEIQKRIFDIISEAIGHGDFGTETSVFDAGLTSIGALKLNVALGKEFDVSIKLSDIKKYDTVKKLEALVSSSEKAQTRELARDYPITMTQKGIFVECSIKPDSVTYNMPLLMKLGAGVDTERLSSAVKTAIDAHPYIKARLFADESGDIRASRNDAEAPCVTTLECDNLPEDLVRPFELTGASLYRAEIYKTSSGSFLFLDFHHIISDGVSEAIFLSDVDRAYAGDEVIPEKHTGFDVAIDEETSRKSEKYAEAKAYYDGIFSGCDPDCLPPKSPESKTAEASSVKTACTADAQKIKAFCKEHSVSENAFFTSAFGFTLSRFAMNENTVFTTVYNGRNDSLLSSTVTMLVKTLPVLINTEKPCKTLDLIRETQERLLGCMTSDIFSFAEVSASYGIRSDIIFVYQGDNFEFDTLCGEKAEQISVMPSVAKAPISLNVYLRDGKLEFEADYRRDMYSVEFIESFLGAFDAALSEFIEKETTSEISLLSSKAERFLAEMNDTKREFENIPVNKFFERHAAEKPNHTALICRGESLTYDELNRLSNRMAHSLVRLGVKLDSIVGFVLERSLSISPVELAILKAGGAFLGILPSYPDDRIDFCLRDAESPVVITTEEIKAARPALFSEDKPYRTVTVEELRNNEIDYNPDLDIPTSALAYCIYTSGSTGNPKGVMIEHHNLACCAQPFDSPYILYHGEKGGEIVLALSSVSFDVSIFDNLILLLNRRTVCMATDYEIHNPVELARVIAENRVDTLIATPSLLTNYIDIPEFSSAIKNIRTTVAGAEAFPALLYDKLKAISAGMHIINAYGPSECTITCCSKELFGNGKITIGAPSPNTEFYVFDKSSNILPPYACGELIICGDLVGRGYRNLPEKTRASFFNLYGRPAYHSGDTVRINSDGEIEFFGRIDNQIKLRGFRIELDEIEKCICSFEGVKQSKVIVRNNGTEDYLAGFFTSEREIDISALTAHLREKLTYYMIPDVIARLDAMPLTPNGKIDKKALPEITREHKKSGRRAPKKSLEQELCELFGSVLSSDEYYADDNFFEMGGTSLSASKVTMQLMSRGMKVEYQDVFDNPTPESLAEYIESQNAGKPAKEKYSKSDSSDIDELLSHNSLEYAAEAKREPLGDVLLTGAVGFLGIHVLKELLETEKGRITCLVRKGDFSSPESRLKSMLMYYFGQTFDEAFGARIDVVDADITDDNLSEMLSGIDFDTLINCAACVKHYASSDIIEQINVHGVENLIRCVTEKNARMIQISTTSVPGVHTEETYKTRLKMHENELFVVDSMDNKYCISKYHAELKMLDAIRAGMRGKIIRVGNLMGRHSDGEFQINFNTNAFIHALRGFATIGKSPISHSTDPMSFSPIDMTAKAIVLLAGTGDEFTAFNADSRFAFDEMQLIDACNRCGIKITPVDDKEYYSDYYRMLGDENVNSRLSGLVTNDRPDLHVVDTDNTFTANVLYRLGFSWPLVDGSYLDRVIKSLKTIGYFDCDELPTEEEF